MLLSIGTLPRGPCLLARQGTSTLAPAITGYLVDRGCCQKIKTYGFLTENRGSRLAGDIQRAGIRKDIQAGACNLWHSNALPAREPDRDLGADPRTMEW
jgi:hypothetical protein